MARITSNGIEIAYTAHGDAQHPVMLMLQGLGMPSSAWPPELIDALVAGGYRVITLDNRDIGRSQLLAEHPVPNMLVQLLRAKFRLRVNAPYQLDDMMRDVVGLMQALSISSAHVVGVSMGGMIAQLLALAAPERVGSLTSIMSTSGARGLPGPTKAVRRHVLRGPRRGTDEARFAYHYELWRLLGSPAYRQSDTELNNFLQRIFDRGVTDAGTARQLLAILAARSRAEALSSLAVPALVIHGDADPLIPLECGLDTARAIPGAKTEIIEGMGHDLPLALVDRLARRITRHAREAGMPEAS
jgi:pimeloyl-ACP methyl ester carboxylesterase